MKNLIVAALMVVASVAYAQDPNFEMLNVRSSQTVSAAAVTPPPAGASGQGAPWAYYGSTNYGTSYYDPSAGYNTNSTANVQYRYQNVRSALSQYASYYSWGSQNREYYNSQIRYGEDLYVRYLKYRDAYSGAALNQWLQQWEYQLNSGSYNQGGWNNGGYNQGGWNNGGYDQSGWNNGGGWNTGYTCTCYRDAYGRVISTSCRLHYSYYQGGRTCGCYTDQWGRTITRNCSIHGYYYPQGSYAYPYYQNNNFVSGLQIGNGIGNIINGNRYDNNLQTIGGALSTAGGILDVINGARRY